MSRPTWPPILPGDDSWPWLLLIWFALFAVFLVVAWRALKES